MPVATLPGCPPLAITLRRSARARRISLRVSAIDGRVTLTVPRAVPERTALAFAREREAWLRARLAETPATWRPCVGSFLPFTGRELAIVAGDAPEVRITTTAIHLPAGTREPGATLRRFLLEAARQRLTRASDAHAARLGRAYRHLRLRDPRSRWGSCSAAGDLMYSWRLVMAPPEVLDYVAAHEVAHLAAMDHSPAFWEAVATLCPGHAAARRWLRTKGPALHRIRFEPAAGAR